MGVLRVMKKFSANFIFGTQVSAYFAGHEHSLLHLRKDDVEHIVSGAGSRMQNCWPNYLRFGAAPESQMSLLGGEIKMWYVPFLKLINFLNVQKK
jgi:hypothetical protein